MPLNSFLCTHSFVRILYWIFAVLWYSLECLNVFEFYESPSLVIKTWFQLSYCNWSMVTWTCYVCYTITQISEFIICFEYTMQWLFFVITLWYINIVGLYCRHYYHLFSIITNKGVSSVPLGSVKDIYIQSTICQSFYFTLSFVLLGVLKWEFYCELSKLLQLAKLSAKGTSIWLIKI